MSLSAFSRGANPPHPETIWRHIRSQSYPHYDRTHRGTRSFRFEYSHVIRRCLSPRFPGGQTRRTQRPYGGISDRKAPHTTTARIEARAPSVLSIATSFADVSLRVFPGGKPAAPRDHMEAYQIGKPPTLRPHA